jgi:4-amino-4-deoxy-L-arabinose transferase-like glycosyltransferase/membrane-associated phospholipid phosphatase
MSWLQTIDINLFRFINQSLANPIFDWLMPVLSANALFFPLLFVVGFVLLWKSNVRRRVCVLMLLIILPLGDGLITNTLKHTVARPRPFVTLPEARLFGTVGKGYVAPQAGGSSTEMVANKGNNTSLPSAHAANWFAATMILFIFYRRSLWIMLPLGLAVSFSRIYNGVHYPSDVLIGAIVGAGYAAAGAVGLQILWHRLGRKWFPLWHQALPSLLHADSKIPQAKLFSWDPDTSPQTPNSEIDQHWLNLGYLLIGLMLIGRWLYLAAGIIDLSEDEAYQWLWSKHLALSYYSKPPGIALIQFVGTSLFGDTQFGVRFFSPLFASIMGVLLLRFMAREVNARTGFWLLLVVTATPLLGAGAILMTIDPPLVLCWTWAMIAGWRAVQADGRARHWVIVGLALGLGFLCKYSAALQIVCWVILFVLWPAGRMHLHRPGPWLALLVFLVCTLPVIVWNAHHGWITVHHVAGNAGLHGQWHFTLRYFTDFSLSELGLLNPIFFLGSLWAMFAFWPQRHERPLWLYLFCMGAPLFLGYWLWSFHSRVQANWIAPAILPMFCLMLLYWHGRRGVKPLLAVGLALGCAAVILMYQSNFIGKITGQSLPGEMDPARRVRAWKPTAVLVEAQREKLAAEGKPAFIIGDHYGITGLCTFYSPPARAALKSRPLVPLVYCVESDEPRNQLFFWPEYRYRDNRKGQNAIFVTDFLSPLEPGWFWKWLKHQPVGYGPPPPPRHMPPRLAQEFESVTDLGEFDIKIGNRTFRCLHLWACYNLK